MALEVCSMYVAKIAHGDIVRTGCNCLEIAVIHKDPLPSVHGLSHDAKGFSAMFHGACTNRGTGPGCS